jgi:ParB family chromosome partitioning protein
MTATRSTETFRNDLQIDLIRASSTNPRQHFDPAGLDDLKRSIEQLGITDPLLVRSMDDGDVTFYELVSGHRRLRAAQELGLATVPVIIREMTDEEASDAAIVANLQRVDIHPVEEAEAYRALVAAAAVDGRELTAEDIAKRVGKKASHVAQLLKVLDLEIDAKLLFSRGHITLGHALLLAKLTPANQERALRFMLDCDPKYDKSTITELVRSRLGLTAGGEEPEPDPDRDGETNGYNMTKPQVAKYMRIGRRLIDATEAQLKRWIADNVLLLLSAAPWRLDDAALIPAAGACTTCPKRSGSNIALFGDLTAAEDVCSDGVCYTEKQKAFIVFTTDAAKVQKAPLSKLSSKRS